MWERFGDIAVLSEPFAGSLAVTLHNPIPCPREIVCDIDGGICNFWRAVRADPEAVAFYADYPTIHQDLTARHRWLVRWVIENAGRLEDDPDYYDVRAAGWWVWGISLWIGGGWCQPNYRRDHEASRPKIAPTSGGHAVSAQKVENRRPKIQVSGGGTGISAQNERAPRVQPHSGGTGVNAQTDKRPYVPDHAKGRGVSAQAQREPYDQRPFCASKSKGQGVSRQKTPLDKVPRVADKAGGKGVSAQREVYDKKPNIPMKNGARGSAVIGQTKGQMPAVADWHGGMGVSAQRTDTKEQMPAVEHWLGGKGVNRQRQTRPDLIEWFGRLSERLYSTIVLNRDWTSAVTPTVLQHTPTGPKPAVGVFLDPPYLQDERSREIYGSDAAKTSNQAAQDAWAWAVEHGELYRIAYCCHEGDVEVPPGWTVETQAFSGIRKPERRGRLDAILFSPACLPERQPDLF